MPTQTPFQTADWKTGAFWDSAILGSSLTVVLSAQAPVDPKTAPMFASQVEAAWEGHVVKKGYVFTLPCCPPKGGYNSWHKNFIPLLCR